MSKFSAFFKHLLDCLNRIPKHIREYIAEAELIAEKIRTALESDIAIDVTTFINGDWDEETRLALIAFLTEIIDVIKQIQGNSESANIVRSKAFLGVVSGIVAILDKKEESTRTYDMCIQGTYTSEQNS